MGRNPVVGARTETLAFVVVLLSSKIVQPVREEVLSLGGDPSEVPAILSVSIRLSFHK